MTDSNSDNQITETEIEQEYQEFHTQLDSLRKEQDQLIKEYKEKLEQRRFAQLEDKFVIKE